MPVVKSLLDAAGVPHDKTFVRPDTTVEVTDNAGNKTYKQVKDLSNEEKAAFDRRGTSATGASLTGRTSNPLIFATNDIVEKNTPRIEINSKGTGLVLSGTKAALDSDMGNELQKYLKDTFKYADLTSKNVGDAINALNQSIRDQMEQRVSEGMLSVPYDDYKEYKLTMQQFQGTNPLSSTAAVPGYTKDGKKINATDDNKKTIKGWLEYYQKNYSAKERAELYNASREAIASGNYDFALWTPYLVMSGGNLRDLQSRPVYGFSTGERALAGAEALLNEGSARLVEGLNQTIFRIGSTIANAQGFARRDNLKNRARRVVGTGSDIKAADIPWISESAYNERLNSIKDKSVRALGKDDKNFLAAALGDFSSNEVDDAVRNSGTVGDLAEYISYNNYINARDNLSTVEKYDEELNKISKKAAKGREWLQEDVDTATLYAPFEVTAGSFAGTIMRMWAESGLIKAATGGLFAPAEISDAIAGKFMSMLSPTGNTLRALQTPVGSFLLSVAAEVPEDLVQTVVDDVMTGRAGDVPLLAPTGDISKDMEKLGESFAQNLAFRLIFTPIQSGANTFRNWRAAKRAARAAGIPNNIISDEYFIRTQQLKEAADADNIVDVTENSATIRNPDGTETVLDNVAMLHFGTDAELQERYPAVAEMLRKKGLIPDTDIDPDTAKIFDDPEEMESRLRDRKKIPQEDLDSAAPVSKYFEDYEVKRIEDEADINTIIDNKIPQRVQQGWYADSGDVLRPSEAREVMAIAALRNTDLRNAALNKAYNVFYEINSEAPRLPFEEWAETPITLVRRFDPEDGVGASSANVLSYSMRPGGLAAETYGEGTDTISIAPKNTVGMLLGADDAGFRDEGEIFVPTALIEGHPKYLSVGDIVGIKQAGASAEIDEVPDSSSYRWESPDVTKTYTSEAEVFADMPIGKNLTEVRQWEKNAHAFYMGRYMQQTMPEFTERYPTVDEQQQFVRNMDYLFDLQRIDGETVESAVGKTFENEGVVYTVSQDDIDFYQNYVEPQMKGLREAGAAAVGKEAFTITGYLPHSDYDPTILTAEDSMQQGVLWREYTGASTTDEDGNFSTGWLNPDLTARYSTFVHNMLWDSLGDNVTVAKYMEEFNADGLDVAATTVERMVGGRKRLAHLVSESDSVKAVVKNLLGDGELPSSATLEKAAKDIGSTNIVHELYRPIYGEAKGLYQAKSAANVKLMSKSDWMRSLSTGDGTLYDNGGAMIVNGAADAKFLAKRITDAIDNGEKLDVHQMFVDYLTQSNRRTAKGASYVADKWMDKIAQKATNGGISRRALTAELNSLIYGEGANRLFRFIGRMDADQLTSANRQALDSLLFRHSALSKIKNTSGFSARINNAANKLIAARMKSLFWLNFKNAVLQTSECIRLFTEFKFGDARATIKKLATDADFRARVDEWVDMLVPERFVKSDSTAATGAMEIIADNSSVKNGELTVNKLSADDIRKFGTKLDEFGNAPVELGEAMKNRVMMAGILQEADRMGLDGNEMFNYVNQRFERIGIAANEMGRLNASDNPLFRIGANLKTFQIRQFRMFINNIHDANGAGETATYIIKNLGWKAGLALIMGKLGYSTAATLGLDPFDLMDDDYTGVDEDNYTGLDYAMLSPVAKLFLSGGFTGYITDAYWAARKAYEDNATVTEQTEGRVSDEFWPGMALPGMSFDNVFNAFSGFIPGYTFGKRVYQMNELMDTGWATSFAGNKMYQAPTNPLDIATGYIFGRSNTPNARAYYQTPDYLEGLMSGGLAGLGQQLGREFGGYRQFDPIDTQNYTDWFNGTAADEQQWNSGYYYFRNKVDNIQKEYQNSLGGYTTDQDKSQLDESFNQKLAEVEDQLNRFVSAYEAKHPEGIDARKMRNLTNILNLYQPVVTDTEEEREQRELDANSAALYRYTQTGLPAVTSYKRNDEGEVEPVYSPQLRSALQGEFGLPKEAATQIQQLYKSKWKKLNQQYRDRMFSTKGSKAKKAIQNEYINIVRQDLDPIVQLYGNNIWSNEDVENIIDDVFNSMIPKYGQTPKSYLKNLYKNYSGTIRYNEGGNTTLSQINDLLDQGKTARAKALARTLLQRVQESRTSLNRSEMERLQAILND